jgi:hypothetical protein
MTLKMLQLLATPTTHNKEHFPPIQDFDEGNRSFV